jgi:hypothetical protein
MDLILGRLDPLSCLSVHIMVGNVARERKRIEGKDGVHEVVTTRYEPLILIRDKPRRKIPGPKRTIEYIYILFYF